MNRTVLGVIILTSALVIVSCATSMTPRQFLEEMPKTTKSKFYDRRGADEAISHDTCKLLVGGRKYTAPIGLTVGGDLQNGAAGVDDWVHADGGNAYVLNNFEWISVGDQGATQLLVYFDTILCKE